MTKNNLKIKPDKNDPIDELNNICEECKKEDESVRQNLIHDRI